MKYINVTTPDNIEVEYRLAGTGSRMGAAAIDLLIQSIVFFIIIIISANSIFNLSSINDISFNDSKLSWVIAFIIITYFLIFFGYFLLAEIIMKGQTVGKRILHLRTIRKNGQPITFIQSIIRNIIRVFIDNNGVGILMMLFSKDNRRLGDMAAGTIVISENPDIISADSLQIKEIGGIYDSLLNTSYPLTLEEYEILKDYFSRRDSFIDEGMEAQRHLTEYFSSKFGLNPESVTEGTLYKLMTDNSRMY
ncbi:MAG: RDD family protein [Lachnospiraceae bacterium]|nr:RDD family protein [Lachnospiraceae bacterium]